MSLLTFWIAAYKRMNRKVSGTSILETVVSLTLLLTILTLSFTRIDRVNRSLNPQLLYKAHLISCEVINSDDLLIKQSEEVEVDGLWVKKSLELLESDLYRVEVAIISKSGKRIYSRTLLKKSGFEL